MQRSPSGGFDPGTDLGHDVSGLSHAHRWTVVTTGADLRAIASAYARKGGGFWVAIDEATGALVGSAGWLPSAAAGRPGWVELRKLYVARVHGRRGLASVLCARVEAVARERGAPGVELWFDTRFVDAHRFYAARGYQQLPGSRQLFDVSQSSEYHFILPL
jgi:GNAT superfamily N-acetyltransferase